MRASKEDYEKVAQHCSEYHREKSCNCKNGVDNNEVSCMNCVHFDEDKYCKLNLYDKIMESHSF